MEYRTNDAQFSVPTSTLQDGSINILKFTELGTSLVVTRSPLPPGATLQSNFAEQLQQLKTQVTDLQCGPVESIKVGPAGSVDAVQVKSRFSKGNDKVFQVQLVAVLPGTQQLLALSYVKPEALGATELGHWESIKQSLTFFPA